MSTGFPVNKTIMDSKLGSVVVNLEDSFERVEDLKLYFDTTPEADVEALGYSPAEVDFMKMCVTDLHNLRQVAYGLQAQTPASNFFFNAVKLKGLE